MSTVLVTGATGKLGKEVIRNFKNVLAPGRSEFDITSPKKVDEYVSRNKFDAVLHLAAITDLELCEENRKKAWETNVNGTANLIRACEKYAPDCYFVYMSTPGVFSGEEGNYKEDSVPYPKNFYGLTKLAGELLIEHSKLRTLVVRGNFVTKEKWPFPKAFVDRFGTYLFIDTFALALKEVMDQEVTGIIHLVGDKKLSMFDLAKMTSPKVEPMTLNEYKGKLLLNKDMSLDSTRWKKYKLKL